VTIGARQAREICSQSSRDKEEREVSMSLRKGIIIGIVAMVLYGIVGLPPVVWAQETYTPQQMETKPTGTEIMFDLLVMRPVGMVGLAMGTTLFVAALPFLLVTGSAENAADTLVDEPFTFTFVRGMGQY
jgi:hypothetical protein